MNTKTLRRRVRALFGDPIVPSAPAAEPLVFAMPENDDEKPGDQPHAPPPGAAAELHEVRADGTCKRPGCKAAHFGPEGWG